MKEDSWAQSERLHWGWRKALLYIFFNSACFPLVHWLRGLIGISICISSAISDPRCVSRAGAKQPGNTDWQKQEAASRSSQRLWGGHTKRVVTLLKHSARIQQEKRSHFSSSPTSATCKHTTGTRINPSHHHKRSTCWPCPPATASLAVLHPFRCGAPWHPEREIGD